MFALTRVRPVQNQGTHPGFERVEAHDSGNVTYAMAEGLPRIRASATLASLTAIPNMWQRMLHLFNYES